GLPLPARRAAWFLPPGAGLGGPPRGWPPARRGRHGVAALGWLGRPRGAPRGHLRAIARAGGGAAPRRPAPARRGRAAAAGRPRPSPALARRRAWRRGSRTGRALRPVRVVLGPGRAAWRLALGCVHGLPSWLRDDDRRRCTRPRWATT